MATTYKVLGQAAPAATTDDDLYTVPAATSAVASTLSICNRGVSTTFRVAVRPTGASITNEHYIVYENAINANDSLFLTIGVALSATDVVTVRAGTANVSFSLFGSEIT
jgi:hypothetical protein